MRPSCAVALLGLAGAACGKAEAQTVPGADGGVRSDWSWLTQEFPEVAEVRPLDGSSLQDALLAWAPFGRQITVYDPACRPLVLTREDDLLSGTIHDHAEVRGNTKWRTYDTIQFDERILICSSIETYERTKHGGWVKHSETGSCGDGVGQALSEVTRDAVWYSGVGVELSVACVESVVDDQACAGGARRQCERCDAWGILLESREQGVGFSRQTKVVRTRSTEVDCRVPCPTAAPPQRVTRAGAIVAGREFLAILSVEAQPYLFRTRAACRRFTKQHPRPADDRMPW
jgi:hypothetical protein